MFNFRLDKRKRKAVWDYDDVADVLYISFGNPTNSEGVDIGEGTIVRVRPDSNEITGVTILNPLSRTLSSITKNHDYPGKNKFTSGSEQ